MDVDASALSLEERDGGACVHVSEHLDPSRRSSGGSKPEDSTLHTELARSRRRERGVKIGGRSKHR